MADVYAPSLNTLRPSLQQLDQLVEPLTAGEVQVARALKRLDAGWTVYIKPRVGLDSPDFLVISDTFGVCAITVVDWLPETTRRNDDDDDIEVLGENGAWTRVVEPRFPASRSRSLIYDQFYAMPEDGGAPTSAVRAVVLMPNYTTTEAKSLLPLLPPDEPQSVIGVFGADSMDESIRDLVVGLGCPVPPAPSIAKLRQQVVASERHATPDDIDTSWTTAGIREVAENPAGQQIRRFRGAAGSGKSYALTARAARLACQGKTVLMLTLNVTLANRLRAMATERCSEIGANPTLIWSSNFHTFCTRVVQDAEMEGLSLKAPRGAAWTQGIVAKTEQALEQGFQTRFDAILIDEGQDFTVEWWNLLRSSVLAPGGEMLVVADPTQDIYDRYEWTADPELGDNGFPEDWIDLQTSHRMPNDLLELTNAFATDLLEGEQLLGAAADSAPDGGPDGSAGSVRNWIDIERLNQLGRAVGYEVVRLLRESPTLRPSDIAFVCDYHHDGVAAVKVIEAAGYSVHHIFSRNPDAPRRRRKHRFWPREDAIKGCTVHSLKGWETPALVMGIGTDDRAQRLAYVAMTRVASRSSGGPSFISVVNADSRLHEFGQRFATGSAVAPHQPLDEDVAEVESCPVADAPELRAPVLNLRPKVQPPAPDLQPAPAAASTAGDAAESASVLAPVETSDSLVSMPAPTMSPPTVAPVTVPAPPAALSDPADVPAASTPVPPPPPAPLADVPVAQPEADTSPDGPAPFTFTPPTSVAASMATPDPAGSVH